MDSWTGMLSTTDHTRPAASISSLRRKTSSRGHASPEYMWCKALTIPVVPACLASSRLTGSFGPYHRQVSFMFGFSRCLSSTLDSGTTVNSPRGRKLTQFRQYLFKVLQIFAPQPGQWRPGLPYRQSAQQRRVPGHGKPMRIVVGGINRGKFHPHQRHEAIPKLAGRVQVLLFDEMLVELDRQAWGDNRQTSDPPVRAGSQGGECDPVVSGKHREVRPAQELGFRHPVIVRMRPLHRMDYIFLRQLLHICRGEIR